MKPAHRSFPSKLSAPLPHLFWVLKKKASGAELGINLCLSVTMGPRDKTTFLWAYSWEIVCDHGSMSDRRQEYLLVHYKKQQFAFLLRVETARGQEFRLIPCRSSPHRNRAVP